MKRILFLDNKLVSIDKGKLSPFNSALLYGESLLEAVPVYGGKPLFFKDHLDRMEKGCGFLGWSFPTRDKFKKAIALFSSQKDTPENFMIRFSLVQEMGPPGNPRQFSKKPPRLYGMIRSLRHQPEDPLPVRGKIGISHWAVPGNSAAPDQFKWIFYMMIRQDFRLHPQWDEMLRLDEKGFVVDGGGSSPLWFVGGRLIIPPSGSAGLESVTRKKILNLCRGWGIEVAPKKWKPAEAVNKGELFFTGSGIGILEVTHLEGRALKGRRDLTRRLWDRYRLWMARKPTF